MSTKCCVLSRKQSGESGQLLNPGRVNKFVFGFTLSPVHQHQEGKVTSSAANERHWYWLMELKVKVLMHLTGTFPHREPACGPNMAGY